MRLTSCSVSQSVGWQLFQDVQGLGTLTGGRNSGYTAAARSSRVLATEIGSRWLDQKELNSFTGQLDV